MNDIALLFKTEEDRIAASVALKLLGKNTKHFAIINDESIQGIRYYSNSKNLWFFIKNCTSHEECIDGTLKVAENLTEFLESINV